MMNEFLGFVVLTSPLFLIVLWVPACIALAIWVSRKFIKKGALIKIVSGLLVFLLALFLPVADEVTGRIYLNHLCETEAGVKVYKTVELPAEYWDEQGKPKFMNSRGVLDMRILGSQFEWQRSRNLHMDTIITIVEDRRLLYDKQSKQVLGEKIDFARHFGWVSSFSPAPNVSESCRDIRAEKYSRSEFALKERSKEVDFILKMFIRSIYPAQD